MLPQLPSITCLGLVRRRALLELQDVESLFQVAYPFAVRGVVGTEFDPFRPTLSTLTNSSLDEKAEHASNLLVKDALAHFMATKDQASIIKLYNLLSQEMTHWHSAIAAVEVVQDGPASPQQSQALLTLNPKDGNNMFVDALRQLLVDKFWAPKMRDVWKHMAAESMSFTTLQRLETTLRNQSASQDEIDETWRLCTALSVVEHRIASYRTASHRSLSHLSGAVSPGPTALLQLQEALTSSLRICSSRQVQVVVFHQQARVF